MFVRALIGRYPGWCCRRGGGRLFRRQRKPHPRRAL